MTYREIGDKCHVSRYCRPRTVGKDNLPTADAFKLRKGEGYLFVNWLEYFGTLDLDVAVDMVRKAFASKGYTVSKNGRFAVLGVGSAKAAVLNAVGRKPRIEHLPDSDDASHAGILIRMAENHIAATALAVQVRRCPIIRPGVVND